MYAVISAMHWKLDSVHKIGLQLANENISDPKDLAYIYVHNICTSLQ